MVTLSCRLWHVSTAIFFSALLWAGPLAAEAVNSDIGERCAAPEYRAFDFWLGEWDVYTNGQLAGHNKIERILQGCALAESWQGASGGRGHSYNAYDVASGGWNQFWVDANGLVLRLVGRFQDGAMTMLGLVPIDDEPGKTVRHQISWTPRPDGSVRQLWQTARSDSDEWQTLFDGLYVPKGAPAPRADEMPE